MILKQWFNYHVTSSLLLYSVMSYISLFLCVPCNCQNALSLSYKTSFLFFLPLNYILNVLWCVLSMPLIQAVCNNLILNGWCTLAECQGTMYMICTWFIVVKRSQSQSRITMYLFFLVLIYCKFQPDQIPLHSCFCLCLCRCPSWAS